MNFSTNIDLNGYVWRSKKKSFVARKDAKNAMAKEKVT